MAGIDWTIVVTLLVLMTGLAVWCKRYTRSVADFLAAGRSAGRYVITVSEGTAALGAITIIAYFEQYYQAGFTPRWWGLPGGAIMFSLALSGFVLYRFRQTRAMTLAQFFEIRYSRRFRVFAGLLAFTAGIVNFGIFPAVGARFFVYFCGLPQVVPILGMQVPTYAIGVILLLAIALLFTFLGGQIAVIVTDFVQGTVCTVVLLVLFVVLARQFHWSQIADVLSQAPEEASLVDPFHTTGIEGFNIYFYLIGLFALFYTYMSWQGTQGYNCSAKSPHEARMGKVLGTWRMSLQDMLILLLPICAYTFMHHPDFADRASAVATVLDGVESEQIQKQVTVPAALRAILPVGAMGCLCAVMLAAFISTHDTYLHSWGSMFVQDVILPFRKKPLAPKQHMRLLRLSICGVAVFVLLFSLLFPQTDWILMFFSITGAIFLGGSGAVIIGGLYWKRGTTTAAWCAMISCSVLAVLGIVLRIIVIQIMDRPFPLDGQQILLITMVTSIALYVVVSLCGRREPVDMDRILHRGQYAFADDAAPAEPKLKQRWTDRLMGREFTRSDKIIYVAFFVWVTTWLVVFVIGSVCSLVVGIGTDTWLVFWRFTLWLTFVLGVITAFWFTIGGLRDLRDMFRTLRTAERDDADDGTVVHTDQS